MPLASRASGPLTHPLHASHHYQGHGVIFDPPATWGTDRPAAKRLIPSCTRDKRRGSLHYVILRPVFFTFLTHATDALHVDKQSPASLDMQAQTHFTLKRRDIRLTSVRKTPSTYFTLGDRNRNLLHFKKVKLLHFEKHPRLT